MSDRPRLAVAFGGVLVLVLLFAAVAGIVSPPAWSEPAAPYNGSAVDPADGLASVPAAEGTVEADAATGEKVVLIDMAHGNAVEESDVQPLVDALVDAGHSVRFRGATGPGPDGTLNDSLAGADAFVSIAPNQRFTPAEARGVADFARRGGRVLLVAEPTTASLPTPLAGPVPGGQPGAGGTTGTLTQVSSQFDVAVGTGYLYNMAENANNYQHVYATPAGGGPLVEGVDRVVLQRATRVTPASGVGASLTATDGTRLSSTREAGTYAVAARSGDVAVVGDASVLEPGTVRLADNEAFVGNLVEHLVTGTKRPAPPGSGGQDPARPGGRPTPPGDLPTPPGDPPTPTETPAQPDNSTAGG